MRAIISTKEYDCGLTGAILYDNMYDSLRIVAASVVKDGAMQGRVNDVGMDSDTGLTPIQIDTPNQAATAFAALAVDAHCLTV